MNRRAVVFAGPRRVEVVDEPLAPPPAGHALVRTRVSAISAGTELLVYRGELPADRPLDESLPALAGAAFRYPARYGYAAVGEVVGAGEGARDWLGRRVFALVPHASAFVAPTSELVEVPPSIGDEAAALFASTETAVTLVLDAHPRLGERAVVVGQGVIGLLATSLLARFPLAALVVVDADAARARRGRDLGATAAAADLAEARAALARISEDASADLALEVSGNPAALDAAIGLTGREGRVVLGSFYGAKRASVDLGTHFHRGRLTLASSQVSHLPPTLGGRWDHARRRAVAWSALARVDAQALVTHRFDVARAADAYARLDAGPGDALQILLTYDRKTAEAR
ncbi:MAG TPA: zinc-binding dehydrogenase [Polyangia bacterium]|nr:zinc-binding dehydrogenase [Polyangia bacterium]